MHRAAFCPRCAGALATRIPEDETRPRFVCTACGFVLYLNPRVAAGTVPVSGGRVALVRRCVEPRVGLWTWPCGYVEIDETVEQAAVRETREECGLTVTLGNLLGLYSYPVRPEEGPLPTSGLIIAAWDVSGLSGELVAGDDADDAAWFPLDGIPWDDLAFRSSHRALRDLLARM